MNKMIHFCIFLLIVCVNPSESERAISISKISKIQETNWCSHFHRPTIFSKNQWSSCNLNIKESHIWPPQKSRTIRIAVANESGHGECWAYISKGKIILGDSYGSFIIRILQDVLQFRLKGVLAHVNTSISQPEAIKDIIVKGNADLSTCHLRVVPIRMTDVYFLHSTLTSTQGLIFTASHLPIVEDVFVLTFSATLWLCFLLALILLVVCFRFSTWLHSFIRPDHEPWSWIEVMLWAVAAVCQQSYSRHPKGLSCRTTFIIGYLITYLLYTGFAAGVTSLLAVQGTDIEFGLEGIVAMKLTLLHTPYTSAEYKLSQLPDSSTTINFGSGEKVIKTKLVENYEELFKKLDEDNFVGVGNTKELEKFVWKHMPRNVKKRYTISELRHSKSFEAMIVSKNSPLKEIFNFWLLRLQESGLLDLGKHRYIDTPQETCCELPGWSSADLGNVLSAVLILTTGYFFSVLILFFEMAWMRKKTGTKWELRTKQDVLRQYNKRH